MRSTDDPRGAPQPRRGHWCDECGSPLDRRRFLQGIGFASLLALAGLGVPSRVAIAMTPVPTRARRRWPATRATRFPPADGVQIDRDQEVILVRWQSAIYAFNLSCPHQRTALRWNQGDAPVPVPQAPLEVPARRHLRLRPGHPGNGPVLGDPPGDEIVVDLDAMHKEDKDRPGGRPRWCTSDCWSAVARSGGPVGTRCTGCAPLDRRTFLAQTALAARRGRFLAGARRAAGRRGPRSRGPAAVSPAQFPALWREWAASRGWIRRTGLPVAVVRGADAVRGVLAGLPPPGRDGEHLRFRLPRNTARGSRPTGAGPVVQSTSNLRALSAQFDQGSGELTIT